MCFVQTTALHCSVHRISIWTLPLSPHQLLTTWHHTRLSTPPPGLAVGWVLNVGSGRIVTDVVHSLRLSASVTGATWVHVDVATDVDVHVATSLTSLSYQSALSTCSAFFQLTVIHQACGSLAAAQSFHAAACVQDVLAGHGVDWSMSAVLTFTSQCQAVTDVTAWPGRTLCRAFPSRHFPVYVGRQCDKRCVFGRFDSDAEACVCQEGFWGEVCDQRCPGDAGKPTCSGHGKCDQNSGR